MYKLYLINFGYFAHRTFSDLDEAKDYAREVSFECTIYYCMTDDCGNDSRKLVASYSPIGGWRDYLTVVDARLPE
jgi:hypothetical protein